ncbi:MlaD family protein [Gordonia rubripertincta]|uniref:MlaD family protein n=1 Tax=Gordonia rubripertincta TaxID=36822 RepID=UPI0013C2AB7D|nr:MlaD family protein [Gordonia rubripertincta]
MLVLVSSCSLRPDDLPSPSGGVTNGYPLHIEFASALNLPTGAAVTMDGLDIGEVTDVDLTDNAVSVTTAIESGTEIPSSATATMRQDTVLGDTYVAIERSGTAGGPSVPAGGTIPETQTNSPPQLEDTLALLATFVNGGNIQKLQTSISKINSVMPNLKDLQSLASTLAVDLEDMARRTSRIDGLLNGLDNTAVALNRREEKITAMLSPNGLVLWDRLSTQVVRHIGTLLPSIGSIFGGGVWMVPMLNSVDSALAAVRRSGTNIASDSEKIGEFLRRTIVPFLERPTVEVTSVSANGDRLKDAENLLRMLGAAR